jgi:predicted transcriptional regulator
MIANMSRSRNVPLPSQGRTLAEVPRLPSLRRIRHERALSIAELAERSGVNKNTISRLESRGLEPRYATIRKLAQALEVEPRTLMGPEAD